MVIVFNLTGLKNCLIKLSGINEQVVSIDF